jgi:chemotaxis signal transduction protein
LKISIGENDFGIPLEDVREVVSFTGARSLPSAPPHVLGLASLREEVIPIIDLRIHLKLKPTLTHDTAVVICKFEELAVGVVVDSIHNVMDSAESKIAQSTDKSFMSDFVSEIVNLDDTLILILDIKRMINAKDISAAMLKLPGDKKVA